MTIDTEKAAPETKAVPETVASAFDEFMEAFEAFREVNDQRLTDMERKLSPDALTVEKMERINRAVDEQKKLLDQLVLKRRARRWAPAAVRRSLPNTRRRSTAMCAGAMRRACAMSRPRPIPARRAGMAVISRRPKRIRKWAGVWRRFRRSVRWQRFVRSLGRC